MITKVLIACCDNEIKMRVKKSFSSVMGENKIIVCNSLIQIHSLIQYEDAIAVVFDKYYLGFVISYELIRLNFLNPRLLTYFVEMGDCSHYFGLRINQLGVDGLISNIENETSFKNAVLKVQNGMKLYPVSITNSIESGDYLLDKQNYSEVTEGEMKVGLYTWDGLSQKEISYKTGLSRQTVSTYIYRLRRKIGYSKPKDLDLITKRYFENHTEDDKDDNKD